MFKRLVTWFFFTIMIGILPILMDLPVLVVTKQKFVYENISSEIFFFDIILAIDGLKELYDSDNESKIKLFLFPSLIIIIVSLSCMYGMMIMGNFFRNSVGGIGFESLNMLSIIFTIYCFIIDLSIQLWRGSRDAG